MSNRPDRRTIDRKEHPVNADDRLYDTLFPEQAVERRRLEDRRALIDGAVAAGKIGEDRRGAYADLYDRDPEQARQVVAAIAAVRMPRPAEGPAARTADDDLYSRLFPAGA